MWRSAVDRTACVNLPGFPVQLLLRRQPDWKNQPVAVVDADKPQGIILWVNERAGKLRILPGMRYAAALSLSGSLRAAVVPAQEIQTAVASLGRCLRSFSPGVEPAVEEPGLFWLDASGLERLYTSLTQWAQGIRSAIQRDGFDAGVVVGFSRFGTYALAKAKQGIMVLKSPRDEQAAARRVPLDQLAFEPQARDLLRKLGIQTVGQFVDLPSEGVANRVGPEAHLLHRLATGQLQLPLQPARPQPPARQRLVLDYPEVEIARLMAVIEAMLHPLLQTLAERGQALSEVKIKFCLDRLGEHMERIRPAAPTRDVHQLLDLIHLRLHALQQLPDGVVEILLTGRGVPATGKQQRLTTFRPGRDPAAANRALARVRAELGEEAVVCARLRNGHLPEARFTWVVLESLAAARPHGGVTGRLIRRIHARAIPLPPPRQNTEGWMLAGLQPVVRTFGPYVVSGAWWIHPVHREYYFAETQNGEILWIYYDRMRRRWFLQGRVE
jgi:protein ImuB